MTPTLPNGRGSDGHRLCNPSRDRQGKFPGQRLFSRKG
jgi:hypothetical protein